jgi:hypothetical protein
MPLARIRQRYHHLEKWRSGVVGRRKINPENAVDAHAAPMNPDPNDECQVSLVGETPCDEPDAGKEGS